MVSITLRVNGNVHHLEVEPRWLLAEADRHSFGLRTGGMRRVHGPIKRETRQILLDFWCHGGWSRDHDSRRIGEKRTAASCSRGLLARACVAMRFLHSRISHEQHLPLAGKS